MAEGAVAPGAGNVARSFVPSILIRQQAERLPRQKRIMEAAVPKKKDSLERPTAVAVIIAIVRSAGDKR